MPRTKGKSKNRCTDDGNCSKANPIPVQQEKATPKETDKVQKTTNNSKQPKPNNLHTTANSHEKEWEDPKFNDSELTMSQLKDMIQTLATKKYEEKFEDLQEEMIEQVEFRVTVQCEGMEETINALKKQVSDMKSEREVLNTTVEDLKMTIKKKDRAIERLQWENQCNSEELETLKIKLDQLEQQNYEKNLRIVGMPDHESSEDEEKKNIVDFAKNTLKLKLKTTDITEVQRMGKKSDKKPSRDLIVKFRRRSVRDNFYKERKTTLENPSPKVYVNEHLTSYRSNLFFAARKLVKSKKIHSTWSQHGNILIRRDETDKPKQLHSHKDLAEFKDNEVEYDADNNGQYTSDGEDSD